MKTNIEELAKSIDGVIIQRGTNNRVGNFIIDSRNAIKDSLFFALEGTSTDGHQFIESAAKRGASTFVISKELTSYPPNTNIIKVDNCEAALTRAGIFARTLLEDSKVVAVTGSCGKTSTKEFLRSALSTTGYAGATSGNLNNHLGVPLTLGNFTQEQPYYILEMGMNHFNEIDHLSSIVKPMVAVITSICPVHLEGVGSLEGVIKAKSEVFNHILPGGTAILPAKEKQLISIAESKNIGVITFGISDDSDFKVSDLHSSLSGARYRLTWSNGNIPVDIPVGGLHQALNSAATLALVHALGLNISNAAKRLQNTKLPGMRSSLQEFNGFTIFNDAYNSSPSSVLAVLNMVKAQWDGDIHLIMGEMLELGDTSPQYHRELGENCNSPSFSTVSYKGAYADEFSVGMSGFRGNYFHSQDSDEIFNFIKPLINRGDLVVVKGSRGIHLENIVKKLENLTPLN